MNLSLKVTLVIDFTMSLAGSMVFSSLVIVSMIQDFNAMKEKFESIVVGVALMGRTVPYSKL
ncbi:hypothetical protein DQQ10_18805 [Pseudochryseolinea flava]|uniref:Uncharacterized protein n=1 Tax=Pseudochryseolinea flava TaxID=2059302 RepID=A0A364XZB7_9BACT|nr:hypothetical protein DQQ10_18805 [Pseudochryseolinea flava]